MLEADAVAGERVDGRGRRAGVAVRAEVIGAERVDRDEDDVVPRPIESARNLSGRSYRRPRADVVERDRRRHSVRSHDRAPEERRVLDELESHVARRRDLSRVARRKRDRDADAHQHDHRGNHHGALLRQRRERRGRQRERAKREDVEREVKRRVEARQDEQIARPERDDGAEDPDDNRDRRAALRDDARSTLRDPDARDADDQSDDHDERRAHPPAREMSPERNAVAERGARNRAPDRERDARRAIVSRGEPPDADGNRSERRERRDPERYDDAPHEQNLPPAGEVLAERVAHDDMLDGERDVPDGEHPGAREDETPRVHPASRRIAKRCSNRFAASASA